MVGFRYSKFLGTTYASGALKRHCVVIVVDDNVTQSWYIHRQLKSSFCTAWRGIVQPQSTGSRTAPSIQGQNTCFRTFTQSTSVAITTIDLYDVAAFQWT